MTAAVHPELCYSSPDLEPGTTATYIRWGGSCSPPANLPASITGHSHDETV